MRELVVIGGLSLALVCSPADAQIRIFGSGESSQPGANPAHERLKTEAQQAYQQGDYERAEQLASSVLFQTARDHVAYYLRGSARVELGRLRSDSKQLRAGIDDVRKAIALDEKAVNYFLPYLYGMTHLAAAENRPEHAEVALQVADKLLTRSLKADEKANVHYQRAITRLYLGKLDDAVADYEAAIAADGAHLGAYVGLAEAYASAGKTEQARQSFDRTVERFPGNPLVYNNRGMFLQRTGKLDEAVADFSRALEMDPQYFYALTNRGYTLMLQGDLQAAEADFSASLRLNGQQAMVYSLRGSVRLDQGNRQGALADYQRMLELDRGSATAHADLGFARYFAEDFAGARDAFGRALQLNPQMRYVRPWQLLASTMAGARLGANAPSKPAGSDLPDADAPPDWTDRLVSFLEGRSTPGELLAAVSADARIGPAQRCEAHFFIGTLAQRAGNREEAERHFQEALQTGQKHLSAYRGTKFALEKLEKAE